MDIFSEQMIKRKMNGGDRLKIVGILVAVVLVIYASIVIAGLTNFFVLPYFVTVGALFGAYWLLTQLSVEYEYAVTNGDITIDKIINKRTRKRVISFDAKNIEDIGRYDEQAQQLGQRSFKNIYHTGEQRDGVGDWYIVFGSDTHGLTLVTFSAQQKILDAIKPYLPYKVKLNAFGRN